MISIKIIMHCHVPGRRPGFSHHAYHGCADIFMTGQILHSPDDVINILIIFYDVQSNIILLS